jgi:hypothetical protein
MPAFLVCPRTLAAALPVMRSWIAQWMHRGFGDRSILSLQRPTCCALLHALSEDGLHSLGLQNGIWIPVGCKRLLCLCAATSAEYKCGADIQAIAPAL